MPVPTDSSLYERAKKIVYAKYDKPSAYRSGALVKEYKKMFQEKYGNKEPYKNDGKTKDLARWFKEEWTDVGEKKGDYKLYRPTVRVNEKTPKTAQEIGPARLKEQDKLKQKIKGKNLPKF